MSIIQKIFKVVKSRPTYLYQYARGTLLFYLARFIGKFLLSKASFKLGTNVRYQSIRNFLCSSDSGLIEVGNDAVIYENARLEVHGAGLIQLGSQGIIGDTRIVSRNKIVIGKRFLTSWNTLIQDFDPHPTSQELRAEQMMKMTHDFVPQYETFSGAVEFTKINSWTPSSAEIIIGDDVWMGANSCILKGTKIGSGSIIATGAVVVGGDFPERSLIAGNPAKLIKELPR